MNALVLHVGSHGIAALQASPQGAQQGADALGRRSTRSLTAAGLGGRPGAHWALAQAK